MRKTKKKLSPFFQQVAITRKRLIIAYNIFGWNWYTVWKLSSWRFRVAIKTGSGNEALKTYFIFYKVTWPAQKWGIVTREVRIVRKSFYTPFRWENRDFIGFLFMFLPKLDRKVVKNEKKQKKAIAFFPAGGHISQTANNNI